MSISEDNIELVVTIAHLVSNALSRATVLEKALALATMDELTSLLNRRGMYERFESEIERARRHHTPITVALIDVDHFKKFNDTYGHLSGDLILKAIGSVFSKSVRKSDVVCRFGGEEFAILLPDTPTQPAYDLLERLRRKIEQMSVRGFNGETLKVTVSIGLASVDIASNITISAQVGQSGAEGNPASNEPNTAAFNSDEDNNRLIISEALAQADEKLYLAKSKGRNQVCCRED